MSPPEAAVICSPPEFVTMGQAASRQLQQRGGEAPYPVGSRQCRHPSAPTARIDLNVGSAPSALYVSPAPPAQYCLAQNLWRSQHVRSPADRRNRPGLVKLQSKPFSGMSRPSKGDDGRFPARSALFAPVHGGFSVGEFVQLMGVDGVSRSRRQTPKVSSQRRQTPPDTI